MATEPETVMAAAGDTTREGELRWVPAEYDETSLVEFLEPDQFADAAAQPVPRAEIGPRTQAALWALRVFALVVSAMVIYTFIYQTTQGV